MNKAFTREPDGDVDDPGDDEVVAPALPKGVRNYLTPAGYKALREELMSLLDDERPKVVDAVLHVAYRVFPDSKAAGGDDQVSLNRGAQALVRLLPGVHW